MATWLIIVIAAVVGVAAVLVGARLGRARTARREQRRARLRTEVRGHQQEMEMNALRGSELSDQAGTLSDRARAEQDEAERLQQEANRHAESARQLDAEAEAAALRGQRAKAAAVRHDERAQEGERQLEEI